ncbi:MAG: hypothetical protein IKM15_04775 [Peptococcaceae bacterium]|nr:hypothetical protein [Peptococcaceae bacterium]
MYFPKTIEELEQRREECLRLVNRRSLLSGAAAAVPIPGVDISADMAIMAELLGKINLQFGLSEKQIQALDMERKKVLLVIISSVGNELVGKTITTTLVRNLLKKTSSKLVAKQAGKFVPFIGQAASAGISFAAMNYLGRNHVEQCYQIALQYMQQIDTRYTDDVIDIN